MGGNPRTLLADDLDPKWASTENASEVSGVILAQTPTQEEWDIFQKEVWDEEGDGDPEFYD